MTIEFQFESGKIDIFNYTILKINNVSSQTSKSDFIVLSYKSGCETEPEPIHTGAAFNVTEYGKAYFISAKLCTIDFDLYWLSQIRCCN